MEESLHVINGDSVVTGDGVAVPHYNSATGTRMAVIHDAGKRVVDLAVKVARTALEGKWRVLAKKHPH
jgi:acyl-CoA reductase-like NAD-dependent aldehyde dehydrogenase